MPLIETLPVGADTAQWPSGAPSPASSSPTRPRWPPPPLVQAELAAVDAACSRFRPDSELRVACRAGGAR